MAVLACTSTASKAKAYDAHLGRIQIQLGYSLASHPVMAAFNFPYGISLSFQNIHILLGLALSPQKIGDL
jgi:hypothetical protein